jgi:mono/diheme cytochrome c family protein
LCQSGKLNQCGVLGCREFLASTHNELAQMRHVVVAVMLAAGPFVVGASLTFADGSGDPAAVKNEGGKYYDKEGNPTFKVQSDGTVDWSTYSGFRRYHSDCHVCHGPDGEGSSYAPALSHVLRTMNYPDFANVVVNGRKRQHGAGKRHAGVRHESKRHVLHRGHIRLSAGARQRRGSAGKTAKA